MDKNKLMSIIAIHQPNFFPWLGYFLKIQQSNTFVFYDSCQSDSKLKFISFAENSLQNGCKIPQLNSANAAFSVRLFANEAVPG